VPDRNGPASDDLRRITTDDAGLAALTLAEAFVDDPLKLHLTGASVVPVPKSIPFFTAFLRLQLAHQLVFTTQGYEGVAVWAPPDQWKVPFSAILRNTPTFLKLYRRRLFANLRVLGDLERHHPTEPHYYLEFIGTSPIHQGKGFGRLLIEPMVARADEEGVGMYLENSKEANLSFYGRFGFETREVLHHRRNGPTQWLMWRDPK
jgi:ribosomal protein S18 acetylase RimI-like enzyme